MAVASLHLAPLGFGFAASAVLGSRQRAECSSFPEVLAEAEFATRSSIRLPSSLPSRELTWSGAIVDRFGLKTYPVERQLSSPLSAFRPAGVIEAFGRNAAVQVAFGVNRYAEELSRAEDEEGEDAPWPAFNLEQCIKQAVPPTLRELLVDFFKRTWEQKLLGRIPRRQLFKMTKDYVSSVTHKHSQYGFVEATRRSAKTIFRAKTTFYLADLSALVCYDICRAFWPLVDAIRRKQPIPVRMLTAPIPHILSSFLLDLMWVTARVGATVPAGALVSCCLPSMSLLPLFMSVCDAGASFLIINPGLNSLLNRQLTAASVATLSALGLGVYYAYASYGGQGFTYKLHVKVPELAR